MSGGVDSSTAAILLKEQGYQITGTTMLLYSGSKAAKEAKKVCDKLKIPHHIFDFRKIFKEKVIDNFIQEYQKGRTPNPCIRCNQYIKFGALLKKAKKMKMDYLASGHYAKIKKGNLYKAKDKIKDQSYFLYTLKQSQLKYLLFPLGDLTKQEVKKIAEKFGLAAGEKTESQEICFINQECKKFLQKNIKDAKRGKILNKQGDVLGEHNGIIFYTIGQRRGIKIPSAKPLYVISIDAKKNIIIVGEEKDLYQEELTAKNIHWASGKNLTKPLQTKAKIRYLHKQAEAMIYPIGKNKIKIKFKKAQRAIAPGQAIVFYKKDKLIGGGIISKK